MFRRRSRTPVPQALTYLIDDVARRHGGLRVGCAGTYLRSDDEALLAEVLADRAAVESLSLRRLAPTVLCHAVPERVGCSSALRDAGYAPVPEDASGATVLARPEGPPGAGPGIAPARAIRPAGAAPKLTMPRLLGIVEQIRRGEAAARAARRAPVDRSAPANGHGARA